MFPLGNVTVGAGVETYLSVLRRTRSCIIESQPSQVYRWHDYDTQAALGLHQISNHMIDLSLFYSPSCAIHIRFPFFPIGNLFQFTSSGIIDSVPEPQRPTEP